MHDSLPEILTLRETAQYLRIPLRSMNKLAVEGKVPCQKVGRHWRFHKEGLDRWLQQMGRPSYSQDAILIFKATEKMEDG